jgi:asparagine synthase (glutamine-hydrolysing)
MSGVFAYSSDRAVSDEVLDAICRRTQVTPHVRASAVRVAPDLAMGIVSLGIFGWEREAPVWSPEGDVALWMVGEFFHYRDRMAAVEQTLAHPLDGNLARFALEVYRCEGLHGLGALSGTYQIAVWDARTRELALINDRAGFYPHYVFQSGSTLAVAPSLAALMAAPEVPAVPDDIAVAQFLRFQQLLGRRSWLKDVTLIPPATILRFRARERTLTSYRYWDWDHVRPRRSTREDALEECRRLFSAAVEARATSPRTALLLSGGLDSRTILAFVRDPAHQQTLTYGTAGSLDVDIAAQVARTAGSPHEWEPYQDGRWVSANADTYFTLTEGAQSVIHSHGLSMVRSVRDRVDVVLTGWGGGTVVGGYLDSYEWDARYRAIADEATLTRAMYEAFSLRLTWPGLTDAEAEALTRSAFGRRLEGLAYDSFRSEFARTQHQDPAVRLDGFYIDEHERRGTLHMHVMARGYLEARAPFKDDALVSFFFSLPESVRRSPLLIRALLHAQSPELAAISYEKDGLPPHPSPMIRRAHRGMRRATGAWQRFKGERPRTRLYADYEQYLRTDLRTWAEELLFGERTRARGWFDRATVEALWRRHLDGRELWTIGKIMPLITIEQVMRHLFDDAAPDEMMAPTSAAGATAGGTPPAI